MYSFLISLLALVAGYFIYGKVIEKVFGIDSSRKTPAITHADGVDFIPMPAWKVYMIQFLNIAGTDLAKAMEKINIRYPGEINLHPICG